MSAGLKERLKFSAKVWNVCATVLVSVFGVVMVVALSVSIYQRYSSTGLYRTDYEGRIVDKSATITESEQGSGVVRRLRVRARNGEEFQVSVNGNLYERAQVGMWIKSKGGSAELMREEPR